MILSQFSISLAQSEQLDTALQQSLSVSTRTPKFIPGSGYWTEVLAEDLHDHGHYAQALGDANGSHVVKAFAPRTAFIAGSVVAAPMIALP